MKKVVPIVFDEYMVHAVLDNRKKSVRKLVRTGKSYPEYHDRDKFYGLVNHLNNDYKNWYAGFYKDSDKFIGPDGGEMVDALYWKTPCKPGDILYVKETWTNDKLIFGNGVSSIYRFKADGGEYLDYNGGSVSVPWKPAICMPKEAARIWLKVEAIIVERLQDMWASDVSREGILFERPYTADKMLEKYANIWDSKLKKHELSIFGWDANPYVYVIDFTRCEKPDWIK